MINEKDKKLLKELLRDGRQSLSGLARRCPMSRQGVFSRIKSLRKRGVIQSFTATVDQKKLGLELKVYILVSADPLEEFREKACDALVKMPEISEVHQLFGRFDFIIEVAVRDISKLKEVVAKIHELEMVNKTETLIVYKTEKNNPQHPIEETLK